MIVGSDIETCEGYLKLKSAVDADEKQSPGFHDYRAKLAWVVERAQHYADKTGLTARDILDSWELERTYWYMNFYQDCNQPKIEGDGVRVFETADELKASIMAPAFRCPACGGVSKDPYVCDSGILTKKAKNLRPTPCDWKVYGLFGDLGKGVCVFVKAKMRGERIFMPLAWETTAIRAERKEKTR